MQCPSCGALMRLVRDKDYFVCDYCTAFHFPEEAPVDGVRVLDEDAELDCPVCHRPLKEASIEGNRALHCTACKGVLANRGAFTFILQSRRHRARNLHPAPPRPLNPEDLERVVSCPSCGQRMDTHPYYGPGAVVIDTCGRCALIWLDRGEIDTIVSASLRERR